MKRLSVIIILCCLRLIANAQIHEDIVPPIILEPEKIVKKTDQAYINYDDPDPQYPGGFAALYKYLDENIIFPKKSLKKKIKAKCYEVTISGNQRRMHKGGQQM
jgi:hypothetical protein